MSDLAERLRQRGWRMTAQRRVVADVLAGEHVHMTAEAVHAASHVVLPEISMATVYNTLNDMVSMGEVMEVFAGNGPKRYDPNARHPHQHLICVGCAALWDVAPSGEEQLTLPPTEQHDFQLVGVDVIFRGLCPTCRGA